MAQRTCAVCGTTFEQTGAGHPKRYCSPECFRVRRRKSERRHALAERPCAQCGLAFQPSHWRQKYCSQSCEDRAYYQRKLASTALCSVKGCGNPILQRGMCGMHYTRWRRHGDPTLKRSKPLVTEFRCSVALKSGEKCGKPSKYMSKLGPMCGAHYQRFKKYGDPLAGRALHGTGSIANNGYRMIGKRLEHRVVMERVLGRKLERHETVHHINGDRTDNRPENLQLWIKKAHVPGQSVEDQVRWAREVLAKYEPILDRLPARGHRC